MVRAFGVQVSRLKPPSLVIPSKDMTYLDRVWIAFFLKSCTEWLCIFIYIYWYILIGLVCEGHGMLWSLDARLRSVRSFFHEKIRSHFIPKERLCSTVSQTQKVWHDVYCYAQQIEWKPIHDVRSAYQKKLSRRTRRKVFSFAMTVTLPVLFKTKDFLLTFFGQSKTVPKTRFYEKKEKGCFICFVPLPKERVILDRLGLRNYFWFSRMCMSV